jgi:GntR family transcriptional regulator
VREVVEQVIINPNAVLKAYRELEHEGLMGSSAQPLTRDERTDVFEGRLRHRSPLL